VSARLQSKTGAAFPTIPSSMLIKLLKSKIHNATVTFTDVNYHGSITIDSDLLRACGLLPNEAVIVADSENGNRFETYVIAGQSGSGTIGINGAAARLSKVGNRVIIMSFVHATPDEVRNHRSRVVIADARNKAAEVIEHASSFERQGG
jgi:aspartate 1-decarboxylase